MHQSYEHTSIRTVIAWTLSDIEIFLLKNEDQETFKDQATFTRDEILYQLWETCHVLNRALERAGFDVDKPLEFDPLVLLGNEPIEVDRKKVRKKLKPIWALKSTH